MKTISETDLSVNHIVEVIAFMLKISETYTPPQDQLKQKEWALIFIEPCCKFNTEVLKNISEQSKYSTDYTC